MFAPVDELFRLSQPPFSFASFQFFKFMFIFRMQINVRVTTMDAELEFAIQQSTTGKQLFDQVKEKKKERC